MTMERQPSLVCAAVLLVFMPSLCYCNVLRTSAASQSCRKYSASWSACDHTDIRSASDSSFQQRILYNCTRNAPGNPYGNDPVCVNVLERRQCYRCRREIRAGKCSHNLVMGHCFQYDEPPVHEYEWCENPAYTVDRYDSRRETVVPCWRETTRNQDVTPPVTTVHHDGTPARYNVTTISPEVYGDCNELLEQEQADTGGNDAVYSPCDHTDVISDSDVAHQYRSITCTRHHHQTSDDDDVITTKQCLRIVETRECKKCKDNITADKTCTHRLIFNTCFRYRAAPVYRTTWCPDLSYGRYGGGAYTRREETVIPCMPIILD